MLEVLARCFPDNIASAEWTKKIKTMIPSYGQSLVSDKKLLQKTRARTTEILKLEEESVNPE
jgi:malate dehydrogenase (quinone)